MKTNVKLFSVILIALLCFSGCEAKDNTTKKDTKSDATKQSETAVTEGDLEQTNEMSSDEHQYIPTKEGDSYYSMKEDGLSVNVKTQQSGTCWTNAITSSIEANYLMMHNEKISLDPSDLCLKIYDNKKAEGWFVKTGNQLDYGGWNWMACEYLPNGYDGYYLEQVRHLDDDCDVATVKECIKKYGAVTTATNDVGIRKAMFDGYMTMNDPTEDNADHEVLIIGWDDNFPKDYYNIPAKENGAWLCQNSKSEGWGNDGCYWISYESPLTDKAVYGVTKDYSSIATYDFGNENRIQTGDETVIANVFHQKGTLAAVGTFTGGDNQEYTIQVYDDKFETVLSEVNATMDINGYQVVKLPEPIEVEDYAIVIRFKGSAPVEGESFTAEDPRLSYQVACEEGQSFVLIDGNWEDLAKESTKTKLGIDFMPNNACIKGLYK